MSRSTGVASKRALPVVSRPLPVATDNGQRTTDDKATATPLPETLTPVDLYLHSQQDLTAVERFARRHEVVSGEWCGKRDHSPLTDHHSTIFAAAPAQTKRYSALLPARPPAEGEQYAFEVDLDRCSGCKACVTACHSLNGLDEGETWRDVGLLHGGTDDAPVLQHVTTACHHCIEPACAIACPVDAYEKDPVTGIVRHLDDQCFGCQYCTLACPYDVPKYHRQKGIVRKCDMCSRRLAVGEAPACVQACPHEAISITLVSREQILLDSEASQFLPGAPDPQHTLPTTSYKTGRPLPRNLLPADYYSVQPEHAHWPLVIMLVLTQLSVGAFLVEWVLDHALRREAPAGFRTVHSVSALSCGLLALAASLFHLGRPWYAFRAVIGLRHSWLSREILAFGLFAPLAAVYAACSWFPPLRGAEATAFTTGLGGSVIVTGVGGVFCSVMIYATTRRAFWNAPATAARFALTTLVLGTATALLTSVIVTLGGRGPTSGELMAGSGGMLCRVLIATAASKLLFESLVLLRLRDRQHTPMKRSALLMTGPLRRVVQWRYVCGVVGGLILPSALLSIRESQHDATLAAVAAAGTFVTVLAGELLERSLFFSAVVRGKMPGGLTP